MSQKKLSNKLIVLISCLFLIVGCATSFPAIEIPEQEPGVSQRMATLHPEVVLVLGSGSARGFSIAGVLKVLEENHIPIDLIVGTSAGSIVGALYADTPNADRLQQILLTAKRDEVIDFSWLNVRSGAISGAGLQTFLTKNMRATTFGQLKIPFVAVAADLESNQIHAFKSGPVAPAVNASAAAPPFFRPVKLYGRTYVDGGLLDPVAVDVAKSFHPKVIIAVKLDYTLPKGLPTSAPGVFIRGFEMMLLKLNDDSALKADVIIQPELESIDMFQDGGRAQLMQAGEQAARKAIPRIKQKLIEKEVYS